jgi:hypothetical protein
MTTIRKPGFGVSSQPPGDVGCPFPALEALSRDGADAWIRLTRLAVILGHQGQTVTVTSVASNDLASGWFPGRVARAHIAGYLQEASLMSPSLSSDFLFPISEPESRRVTQTGGSYQGVHSRQLYPFL